MIRRVITIDEERCTGCGICVDACHEGAIGLVDGVAKLLREDHCDGLGDCLPACPADAISFVEREAQAYDEQAVAATMRARAEAQAAAGAPAGGGAQAAAGAPAGGCPSTVERLFAQFGIEDGEVPAPPAGGCPSSKARTMDAAGGEPSEPAPEAPSRLAQWPCQIKLVPAGAAFFAGCDLLIAADCTAFAYANTHERFMRGRVTINGCPKLDAVDYSEKLAQIIASNDVKSITVLRMEVPCCGGLERAARAALEASGKQLPFAVEVVSVGGRILT